MGNSRCAKNAHLRKIRLSNANAVGHLFDVHKQRAAVHGFYRRVGNVSSELVNGANVPGSAGSKRKSMMRTAARCELLTHFRVHHQFHVQSGA
jgi:hypothetical protein